MQKMKSKMFQFQSSLTLQSGIKIVFCMNVFRGFSNAWIFNFQSDVYFINLFLVLVMPDVAPLFILLWLPGIFMASFCWPPVTFQLALYYLPLATYYGRNSICLVCA